MPGSKVAWDVHYASTNEDVTDAVEMGIYFYPKGQEPEVPADADQRRQRRRGTSTFRPTRSSRTRASSCCPKAARIESFQPHMHLRGKAQSLEAILPTGQKVMLSHVADFNFNWHNSYVYADDAAPLLPKGTVLKVDRRGTTTPPPTSRTPIRTSGSATAIARWTR